MLDISIQIAAENNLPEIVEIYNQAIETKESTADITPITVQDRISWFKEHEPRQYPIYVALAGKKVAGWISLSPYRKGREALKYTAEVSYYIHNDFKRKGIGSRLLEYMIRKAPSLGIKHLFAIILEKNSASAGLLEKFHFEKWAFLPQIAEFDGVPCGQFYYGRHL